IDAVDEHLAACRLLEAAGDRQQGALAGAAGAHDRHELTALDGEVDRAERVHLARAGAVDLRYLAQFECACHCETPVVRVGSSGPPAGAAGGAEGGNCFKRTSAAPSQRTIASSRNSSASATSASGTSSSAASALIRV